MSCPQCGCKVHYSYDGGADDSEPFGDELQRCAACGHVFDIEDSAPEDDEPDEPQRCPDTGDLFDKAR